MKLLISAIALGVLISTPTLAAKKKVTSSPWFIQLSIGSVASSDAEEQALKDLTAFGHEITAVDFQQDSVGYIFELGYRLNENWAISAGYIDFGETDYNISATTGFSALLIEDINEAAPRYGDGNTYSVIYSLPVTDDVVVSADVGILFLESDSAVTVNVGTEDDPIDLDFDTSEHSLQYFAGAVLEYQYKSIKVGVQYRHYEINHVGTEWVGARVGYSF